MKKKHLEACKIYLILDAGVCHYDRLFEVLKVASHAGVDIVQLRDKVGAPKDVVRFSRRALGWLKQRVLFIVNDRVDCALIAGADGVHLGQEDISAVDARRLVGRKMLIGKSCQTLAHVRQAQKDGADYIGFGSVFKTLTKPDRSPMALSLLRQAVAKSRVPLFAIGGIGAGNLSLVRSCGVERIAVCRDILCAKDVKRSVEELRRILTA